MKNIMIHREGTDYGPYSLEEIRDLLSKTVVTLDDMAWVEGAADWVPLKEVFRNHSPAVMPPVPPCPPAVPRKEERVPVHSVHKRAYLVGGILLVVLAVAGGFAIVSAKSALEPLWQLVRVSAASPQQAASPPSAAQPSLIEPYSTSFTLSSGEPFQVISIKQEENEHKQVLCMHYISHVDIHDWKQLNPEVDQIWPLFKDQAERSGLKWAVISPTVINSTFPVEISQWQNYYYKKTNGKWELDFPMH